MALVNVKSVDDLEREEQEKIDNEVAVSTSPAVTALSSYVDRAWSAAKDAKRDVQLQMESNIRQRNGVYDPTKLAAIRQHGGSELYMMLTDEKCTACKAWIHDTLLPANENPYAVNTSVVPELTPELTQMIEMKVQTEFEVDMQSGLIVTPDQVTERIQQLSSEILKESQEMAQDVAQRTEDTINDTLVESNWREAFKDTIEDVVDLPAGIMKGPIVRKQLKLQWVQGEDGLSVPQAEEVLTTEFERVSPFNIFPGPSTIDITKNEGYLIEVHEMSRSSLNELRGVEGYSEDAIKLVLENAGGYDSWLDVGIDTASEEEPLYDIDKISNPDKPIQALQFWGSVQGKVLSGHLEVEDELADYTVELWKIGPHIIKAVVNGDPLGRRPYFKASFRHRNGSFWGNSLPDVIEDIQDMVNASARNLVNNMALASGPQIGVDVSKLAEGEEPEGVYPWKVWQFDETMGTQQAGGRAPIWFFQPNANIEELLKVYEFFSNEADNKSGIPKYTYGSGGSKGALGTATGISMMMSNASRAIKQVIANIDVGLVQASVIKTHEWLMQFGDYEGSNGDIAIVAKGSSALMAKEQQQVRRNEFLNIALNPVVLDIIGKEGVADILRVVTDGLDIDDVVPSKRDMKKKTMEDKAMQAIMMQMEQAQGQAPQAAPQQTMEDGAVAGGGDVNAFQQG